MNEFIVKKISHDDEGARVELKGFQLEPSLLPDSRRILPRFSESNTQQAYPTYLGQRILRNPRDLLAHVQRITLHQSADNADGCYGGLVDLFIILGDKGEDLRRTMLRKSRALLTDEQYDYLSSRLHEGLNSTDNQPVNKPDTCLSKGLSGTANIVRLSVPGGDKKTDVLAQARQQQAEHNISAAQAMLEAALERDPGQGDVCRELLALYRQNLLHDAFSKTYASLLGKRLVLPELWQETEDFLSKA